MSHDIHEPYCIHSLSRDIFGLEVKYRDCASADVASLPCWFRPPASCPFETSSGPAHCEQTFRDRAAACMATAGPHAFVCRDQLGMVACGIGPQEHITGILHTEIFRPVSGFGAGAEAETRIGAQPASTDGAFLALPTLTQQQSSALAHLIEAATKSYVLFPGSLVEGVEESEPKHPVIEVLEELDSDDLHDVTETRLAEKAHATPSRFSHIVRELTGQTFMEHLQHARLALARRLLANSELTIATIAQRCGFDSPSSFTSFFHAATNQTPTQYRSTKV